MPAYDYRCRGCGSVHEIVLPVARVDERQWCPKCGAGLERIYFSPPAVLTPSGPSYAEEERIYHEHNVTHETQFRGSDGSRITARPLDHARGCTCETCGRVKKRQLVTVAAEAGKDK